MSTTYTVQSGDCAWNYAKKNLEQNGKKASNKAIYEELNRLVSVYNCSNIDDFNKKYFSKVGNTFDVKENTNASKPEKTAIDKDSLLTKRLDSLSLANESTRITKPDSIVEYKPSQDSIKINRKTESYAKLKQTQDTINSLPSDKERVIMYNRTMNKSRENYVVVDKKSYTATVYTWDGKVVKEYEVGVAKNKSDALLTRSKKHPEKNYEATSAGIYTANYRATGRDLYRILYNDRILTLSNDGLREKGVGNGETGVALHQVPNGDHSGRIQKIKAKGVSEQNNRFSGGCVNFLPEDFDDCMSHIKGVGTKVYILPEDNNNKMVVKNGKLHFVQEKYTGNVATTTTKNDPVKGIKIVSTKDNMRAEGLDMAKTLSTKKQSLIKDLGIDNDTYNDLASLTLGIAGRETDYGNPLAGLGSLRPYWLKENMPGLVNWKKKQDGNNSYNSRGLTQIKLKAFTDPETQRLLKKYKITEENLSEGKNAAIATMIILSCIYKNELPALKEQTEQLNMSKTDAVLYCYNGKKKEIKNMTATPDKNIYRNEVVNNMKNFEIYQYA